MTLHPFTFPQNSFIARIFPIFAIALSLCLFYACETTETPSTNCDLELKDATLDNTSFSSNATITGSYVVEQNINLEDFQLRSLVTLYLSDDNSVSNDDEVLVAFTAAPTSSGNTTTVNFDQIEIPGLSSGTYFVIFQIDSQPCGNGISTGAETMAIQVTVG